MQRAAASSQHRKRGVKDPLLPHGGGGSGRRHGSQALRAEEGGVKFVEARRQPVLAPVLLDLLAAVSAASSPTAAQ